MQVERLDDGRIHRRWTLEDAEREAEHRRDELHEKILKMRRRPPGFLSHLKSIACCLLPVAFFRVR